MTMAAILKFHFFSAGNQIKATRIQVFGERFGRRRLSYDSRDSIGGTEENHYTSEQFSGSWVILVSCLRGVRDY
jgi:hypothetical protein